MPEEIILQVGVKILLKNKDNKYLLIRRSLKKYPEVDNRWDIVGGRIHPGTPLLDNLKREIKEETDLELVGSPRLIGAQDILRIAGKHIVRITYIGEATGEIKLDTSENDEYLWYDFGELKKVEGLDKYFKELLENGIVK